ncbi:MAG: hypothetical protein ACR2PO_20900 [Methyloligellaceae bacterium]
MAILRSVDGKVYEIPDDNLSQFELPEELVSQISGAMDPGSKAGPIPQERAGPGDGSPPGGSAAPDEGPPPDSVSGPDAGPSQAEGDDGPPDTEPR